MSARGHRTGCSRDHGRVTQSSISFKDSTLARDPPAPRVYPSTSRDDPVTPMRDPHFNLDKYVEMDHVAAGVVPFEGITGGPLTDAEYCDEVMEFNFQEYPEGLVDLGSFQGTFTELLHRKEILTGATLEVSDLEHGDMSVMDYEIEFIRLSRYAPGLVDTEVDRCLRFENGLRFIECDEMCYKNPVLKDQKWIAYIDRSPGAANYSQKCFSVCVAGCGYKFEICKEIVARVRPLPPRPLLVVKPPSATTPDERAEDVPSTSA
ncbi:brain protein 44-like [Hibiscus syriacus]|uniref:Brain protein 44-like n=1 Tax=Hibiscus syriacus TaxID=106335 RepID=A0A6A2Z5P5_HIBSY|nr:brain protein 44-like [Hibiscus syriacus]